MTRLYEKAKDAVKSIFASKPPEPVRPGQAESWAIKRQADQYSRERRRGEELKDARDDARLVETRRVWDEAFRKKEPAKFESDPHDWMWETGRKPGVYERHLRGKADALIRGRNDKAQAYGDMIARNTLKHGPADWMFEDGPNPPSVLGRKAVDRPDIIRKPPRTRPTVTEESIPDNRSFGKKVADKLKGLLWWRKPKAPSEVVIARKWVPKEVPRQAGTESPKEPVSSEDEWLSDAYKSDLWKLHEAKKEYERRTPADALADLYSSFGLPKNVAENDYAELCRRFRSKNTVEALDLVAKKIRLRTGKADGLGAFVQYGHFLKDGTAQAANNRKDWQRGLEGHRESIQRLTNQAMGLRMQIERSKQGSPQLEGQLALPELAGPENNPQLKSPLEKKYDLVLQKLKAAHGAYAEAKEQAEWVVSDLAFQPDSSPVVWDGVSVNPTGRDEDNLLLAREFIEKANKEPMPPARPMVKGRDYDREIEYRGPKLPGPTYDSKGNRIVPPLPKQLTEGKGSQGAKKPLRSVTRTGE